MIRTRGRPRTRTALPARLPGRRQTTWGKKAAIGKIRNFLPLAGFPQKKVVRLRYVDTIKLTDTTTPNLTKTYPFSTNSAYDPDQTIGGHQPYGFDQWGLIYNHYKVLGSKMTLRVTNGASVGQAGIIYGIKVDDDASVVLNAPGLMEQKDSKYDVCVSQSAPRVLTKKWSLKRSMDPTRDGTGALIGANPGDQEYFVIYACPADASNTLGTICFQVQIDYIIQFTELKDFTNS